MCTACNCGSWWQYVITICCGVFAIVQWGRSLRISRSRFVREMLEALSTDDVQDVLTTQDSSEDNWLDSRIEACNEKDDFEAKFRKTLSNFDMLCHLYFIGNISESDLRLFLPNALRLIKDKQVREYIADQEKEYLERTDIKELPYLHLVMLGKLYRIDDGRFSKYQFGRIGGFILRARRVLSMMFGLISRSAVIEPCNVEVLDEERIGKLVTGRFKVEIVKRAEKDGHVLQELQDKAYCKKTFGLTYAVLINAKTIAQKLNRRYYVEELEIGGQAYRLCNNWFQRQRDKIENWINNA